MKVWRWLVWKVRWVRWFLGYPGYRLGDPTLGAGEMRDMNRDVINQRYSEKEPTPSCAHVWARRRFGRECAECGARVYGDERPASSVTPSEQKL